MATTNTPYTRTSWLEDYAWNEIIQEVNYLATNPEDGCDSLDTLDEVEINHIWNKEDVITVQNKLKEICPDNEFTELGELWTSVIIDEIKDAIETGWCECETEPIEWLLGQWIVAKSYGDQTSAFGSQYNKCGGRIVISPWWYFIGQNECQYISPCYDSQEHTESNAILWQTIQDTYVETLDNCVLWARNRRDELLEQRKVEEYSTDLRAKQEQLESLQNQLASCQSAGGDCSAIEAQISEVESEISELENDIAEAKEKRDDFKNEAENYLTIADAAAIANWTALASYQSWDSTAIQVVRDHIGGETSEWGLGSYPYENYKWSTWGVGKTWWFAFNPTVPVISNMMAGKFTPSGLPFSKNGPLIFGDEYFYQKQCRHKCGWWAALAGECTFEEWSDWDEPIEVKSTLNWTARIDDRLQLKYGKTEGSNPVEEYEPNPDQ